MKVLAVCDSELNYARRLAEKLVDECKEDLFLTQLFDSAEAILEYHKNIRVDAVLLGDKVMFGQAESFNDTLAYFRKAGIRKIFILSSDKALEGNFKGYKSFYKYQASTAIVKEIIQAYTQISAFERMSKGDSYMRTEVIGVFSPVNCVEKTIWALLAGMILAKKMPVLYLNMERYAGFDAIFGRQHEADLSEVFYHILHGEKAETTGIKESIQNFKGLSYIPPIRFGQEFSDVGGEVIVKCITEIIELSRADKLEEKYIILDFSGSTEEYIAMSKMCDRIFLVQRSDCITEATVKAFEWELEVLA